MRLYPPTEEMNALLEKGQQAVPGRPHAAMGPFLSSATTSTAASETDRAGRRGRSTLQPGPLARVGRRRAGPARRCKDPVQAGEAKFQELGLGPLLDAKAVKRELWEGRDESLYPSRGQRAGPGTDQVQ